MSFWNSVNQSTVVAPFLSVLPESVTFDYSGEPTQTININSNVSGTIVTSYPLWIKISKSTFNNVDSFTVYCMPTDVNKSGSIVIESAGFYISIPVYQVNNI
jgi:hypothetical protein